MSIKSMRWPVVGLAILGLGVVTTAHAKGNFTPEAKFVPGEMIVKLKSNDLKSLQGLNDLGLTIKKEIKLSYGKLFVLKSTDNSKSLSILRNSLESNPNVEYAEPNYIYSIGKVEKGNAFEQLKAMELNKRSYATPSDPKFNQLWGLQNTGDNDPGGRSGLEGADVAAIQAWELTSGDRAVKIAIIDTGIDYNHPDLIENMWTNEAEANGQAGVDDDGNGYVDDIHGYDFANNDGDPVDGHGHGTHCAGTIGAVHDNGEGVAGVMKDVSLVGIKFLTDAGSGTTADAIRAIDYATTLDVDLMSNSWGGGGFSEGLKEAIERASAKGIIFTAAAGNDSTNNDSSPHYPSNYNLENVISVAAHNSGDAMASFSNYGRSTVHVAAPGRNILSSIKNGEYASWSGTSMATPHVSGVLGLYLAQEGRTAHADMKARLMATSEPTRTYRRKVVSGGRLNAYNLLTDTRPTRSGPSQDDWNAQDLDEVFETAHPYVNNDSISESFTVEGAKYVRLVLERYDVENGYDFIQVKNAAGEELEKITGAGENYDTDYVEGDTISLEFSSDRSVTRWGFRVKEIQYVMD